MADTQEISISAIHDLSIQFELYWEINRLLINNIILFLEKLALTALIILMSFLCRTFEVACCSISSTVKRILQEFAMLVKIHCIGF